MKTSPDDRLDRIAFHLRSALDGISALRSGGNLHGLVDYTDIADRLRRLSLNRAELIPETQFFDPGWNILLDIYVAAGRGKRLSVSAVCGECGVPQTTALRYISVLVNDGLAQRVQDIQDGRRIYVVVTDIGKSAVERWLTVFIGAFR